MVKRSLRRIHTWMVHSIRFLWKKRKTETCETISCSLTLYMIFSLLFCFWVSSFFSYIRKRTQSVYTCIKPRHLYPLFCSILCLLVFFFSNSHQRIDVAFCLTTIKRHQIYDIDIFCLRTFSFSILKAIHHVLSFGNISIIQLSLHTNVTC